MNICAPIINSVTWIYRIRGLLSLLGMTRNCHVALISTYFILALATFIVLTLIPGLWRLLKVEYQSVVVCVVAYLGLDLELENSCDFILYIVEKVCQFEVRVYLF